MVKHLSFYSLHDRAHPTSTGLSDNLAGSALELSQTDAQNPWAGRRRNQRRDETKRVERAGLRWIRRGGFGPPGVELSRPKRLVRFPVISRTSSELPS